jgi:1-acyl-sn-glycerol-3-phosphate acyltransferase
VVPSTVHNAEKIKRKGERLRFPRVTVEYGMPLQLADFEWVPKKERMEAFSWYAMRECFAMKQGVPAEEVDMVALYPADHDYSGLFGAWHPGMPAPAVDAAPDTADA